MATVKVKGLKGAQAATRKLMDRVRKDPAFLEQVAAFMKKDVLGFTRSGKSLETDRNFPGLSRSWKKTRSELLRTNAPSGFFLGSGKSNLTFTGKLLGSIKSKIFSGKASAKVFAQGTHAGYRTKSGKTKSNSNVNIFKWLAKSGRGVFGFSAKVRKRFTIRTNVLFKRALRRRTK